MNGNSDPWLCIDENTTSRAHADKEAIFGDADTTESSANSGLGGCSRGSMTEIYTYAAPAPSADLEDDMEKAIKRVITWTRSDDD
jgi:hypothetical protein